MSVENAGMEMLEYVKRLETQNARLKRIEKLAGELVEEVLYADDCGYDKARELKAEIEKGA